jgi:hypothetical protein
MTGGIATKFVGNTTTTGGGSGSSASVLGPSLNLMFADTRKGIDQKTADAIEFVAQTTTYPERFNAIVYRMKAAGEQEKPATTRSNKIGTTFPG